MGGSVEFHVHREQFRQGLLTGPLESTARKIGADRSEQYHAAKREDYKNFARHYQSQPSPEIISPGRF